MNEPVNILIVEDSEDDAKLVLRALRRGGFDPTLRRAQSAEELKTALAQERWDAVISDFRMPGFTGLDALAILRSTSLDIPFILISGTIGEETAVNAMLGGAGDYVMKNNLARLGPALERELKASQMRAAHRQAQRKLVESELRLRTIIETEPECVKVVSREGVLLEMNAAGLAMLEADSLAAVRSRTLLDFIVPEHRAAFVALHQRVIRGECGMLEFEVIGLKGGRRWLETRAAPLDVANGEAAMLLGVTRDVTERKRAEKYEQFRSHTLELLAGNEPLSSILKAIVTGVEQLNPASLCSILLVDSEGGHLGKGVAPSLPDFYNAAIDGIEIGMGVGSCGTAAFTGERVVVHDIATHPYWAPFKELAARAGLAACWSQPICSSSGKVLGVFAIYRRVAHSPAQSDLSIIEQAARLASLAIEREQAEVTRAQLEAQLRESHKMQAIGTLAGGIAHDFNNILATILGNTELARQDLSSNPRALESLEEIRKAGSRARDLVQQILSFSRRQPTERKRTVLGPIIEESARLLRATLPARVVLEVCCDADVPPVLADITQIEQVLINLVTNAMQAIPTGPGHIGIRLDTLALDVAFTAAHPVLRAWHRKHPGCLVRLAVSDDGPGMDAATLARIFEPFFTTKVVGEGTGLGLAVVHGIVQAHEGAIEVASQPGQGSTFTLYLPMAEAAGAVPAPDQSESATVATAVPDKDGGRHILYLDDDESLVFLLTRLLERRGLRVSGYTDQREALDALLAEPYGFDLVVTDYNMPGMSGLDLAREVRAIRADLPVAVTSGFIDENLRAQADGAGVRELIFKANDVEDMCEAFVRLAQTAGKKS